MSLMNTFWSLFDWFLPSIRLTDDFRLDDPEALAGRTYALHARTLSAPNRSQVPRAPASDAVVYRQREQRKDGERERERERWRESEQLVTSLRAENAELKARIQQLEKDLQTANQSAAHAPDLARSISLPPAFNGAPPGDYAALRTAYDTLNASHTSVQQTLRERNEELLSLRTFLTKTDDMTGAQLVQAIKDLNSEILGLCATIVDTFGTSFDRRVKWARLSDREVLYPALGVRATELLETENHSADPTFVQFALQAWEVACVAKLMVPFCCGVPEQVQRVLSSVFQRMQEHEPQATASRWRALTHSHLRALWPASHAPGHAPPPTPVSPSTPPASATSAILHQFAEDNIRGILAVLILAGCSDHKNLHREPLRKNFGAAVNRINDRAYSLATAIRESVMSAAFEVVIVPPSMSSTSGATLAKKGGLHVDVPGETRFDEATMVDVFDGEEDGMVLCTVELGLACVRKTEGPEQDNARHEDTNRSRSTERYTADGHEATATNGIQRTSSSASSVYTPATVKVLERNLLVRPKVVLDSVTRVLQL